MLGYDKHFNDKHSVMLGKHQNPFSAGAPPQTPPGAQTHPRLPSRLGLGNHRSPLPASLDAFGVSAWAPSAFRTPFLTQPSRAVPSGTAPVCVKQNVFSLYFLMCNLFRP